MKRPRLPAKATKKKMMAINVRLTKIVERMNKPGFVTSNPNIPSVTIMTSNACPIAKVANVNNLLPYQLIAEYGNAAGFLNSTKKDRISIPTNKASDIMYGAVESR